MKISWNWLCHHLNTTYGPEEIVERLTLSGTETTLKSAYAWADSFYVVQIEEVTPHPRSKKLSICHVKTHEGQQLQVVCGAQNVRKNLHSILAKPGNILPGTSSPLEVSVLAGTTSEGMLCSAEELQVSGFFPEQEEGGILDLPSHTFGKTLASLIPENPVLDLEVTPNRGDLLSARGIARELGALGCGTLRPYTIGNVLYDLNVPITAVPKNDIHFETLDCLQYYGCFLSDLSLKQSPIFIRAFLESIGSKLISPIVDMANFLMYDLGRPFHVFNADAIQGTITFRLSQKGESFQGLDEKVYVLPAGLLVMTDNEGIISLPGILGGKRTACQTDTRNVFIECAVFCQETIFKGGQATHIASDARSRFERGLDPTLGLSALSILCQNIALCTPEAHCPENVFSVYRENQITSKPIFFFPSMVESLVGTAMPLEEITQRLTHLGCHIQTSSNNTQHCDISEDIPTLSTNQRPVSFEAASFFLNVLPPPWRHDLSIAEDLVEEIVRLQGYREVSALPMPYKMLSHPTSMEKAGWESRRFWAGCGFFEVITWSFLSHRQAQLFWNGKPDDLVKLRLKNPISRDLDTMRPSLIPNLLDNAVYHFNHGLAFQPIFEWGPQFFENHGQEQMLSGFWPSMEKDWTGQEEASFWDVKGYVQNCIQQISGGAVQWIEKAGGPSWYHPGRSVCLETPQGVLLASLGQLHPQLAQIYKTSGWIFEIFQERILRICHGSGFEATESSIIPDSSQDKSLSKEYSESEPLVCATNPSVLLSPFQRISKDLTFVVPMNYAVGSLLQRIYTHRSPLLERIVVADIFMETETKAITLRCFFQPEQETFSDKDLHQLMDHVIKTACQDCAVQLRGHWTGEHFH